MGKGMYLGVDSKARKVKKMYLGVDGKARKIKKVYIGDADGKARLCWSGFTPMFVGMTPNYLLTSTDGKNWNGSELPFSMSLSQNFYMLGMTYGLGRYWTANGRYLAYSDDGLSWTIVKTNSSYLYAFKKIFFVNGEIIAYERESMTAKDWTLHISSDGKNWRTVHMQRLTHPYNSGGYYTLRQLLYGTFRGEKVYLWLVTGDFPTHISYSGERYGAKIFKSATLEGDWEEVVVAAQSIPSSNSSDVYGIQMLLKGEKLYYISKSGTGTNNYIKTLKDASYGTWSSYGGSEVNKSMLTCSDFEEMCYEYGRGFQTASYTKYYTCSLGDNFQDYLQPVYNEEGLVAFPHLSGGQIYGWYKSKDATAFTKTAKVDVPGSYGNTSIVAVYGVDGGGVYTD